MDDDGGLRGSDGVGEYGYVQVDDEAEVQTGRVE